MARTVFRNANKAYEHTLDLLIREGVDYDNTKALWNVGFYIQDPLNNHITNKQRNWKLEYAEAEWQWYLSGDRNIKKLGELYGKVPPIWERMADTDGNVMSNYGWQWQRNNQIDYVVGKLRENKTTRHAAISIYDAKEYEQYRKDTPCTYAVQFHITPVTSTLGLKDQLNMSVFMRSNDIWYGFCNDQYQFSSLQKLVADRLSIDVGWYYHAAHNMHLYKDKL